MGVSGFYNLVTKERTWDRGRISAKRPIKLGVSKADPRSATVMMPKIRIDGRNLKPLVWCFSQQTLAHGCDQPGKSLEPSSVII